MATMTIKEIQKMIHENAKAHGWWDEERPFGELIALCHSELSEALEEYRRGALPNKTYLRYQDGEPCESCFKGACAGCKDLKPEGIPSELADTVIRIMDICEHFGIDLESAIIQKHAFNITRPYKHGGKVI